MIHYQLLCEHDHEFEAWFRDSTAYDEQAKRGEVQCPFCGSDNVRKAVMAPALSSRKEVTVTSDRSVAIDAAQKQPMTCRGGLTRKKWLKPYEVVGKLQSMWKKLVTMSVNLLPMKPVLSIRGKLRCGAFMAKPLCKKHRNCATKA